MNDAWIIIANVAWIAVLSFCAGYLFGASVPVKHYWEGFDRGYRQCEIDLYGLPDSVPEIKG